MSSASDIIKFKGKLYEIDAENNDHRVVNSAAVASATTTDTPQASVTVDENGTANFTFGIPMGPTGAEGSIGPAGPTGSQGEAGQNKAAAAPA